MLRILHDEQLLRLCCHHIGLLGKSPGMGPSPAMNKTGLGESSWIYCSAESCIIVRGSVSGRSSAVSKGTSGRKGSAVSPICLVEGQHDEASLRQLIGIGTGSLLLHAP